MGAADPAGGRLGTQQEAQKPLALQHERPFPGSGGLGPCPASCLELTLKLPFPGWERGSLHHQLDGDIWEEQWRGKGSCSINWRWGLLGGTVSEVSNSGRDRAPCRARSLLKFLSPSAPPALHFL